MFTKEEMKERRARALFNCYTVEWSIPEAERLEKELADMGYEIKMNKIGDCNFEYVLVKKD